jgi:Asp-tRNA(Asn)/Glu-tRNA(Gln) amidotransferase A subunit family amidase
MTVSWSFDKVTPICRTVEDCAVVLGAIYGPDGKDNSIIDLPFSWDPQVDISKLRIGYHTKFFERELMGNPTDERMVQYRTAIREESKKVLDFFRRRGHELIPLDFEISHSGEGFIMLSEAAAAFDEFPRGTLDDLVEGSNWPRYHRTHRFVPAVEYIQATRYRSLLVEEMNQALKDVDVYIEISWSNNWSTNMTGHPIVVVPCGFLPSGRPVTVTFVGQLFREADLLAVAKTFQDATNFHLRHPEL